MENKFRPYLLLAPILIYLILVFAAGIFIALLQSLGHFPIVGLTGLTLEYYREVLSDRSFLNALGFSLYTSLVSSLVAAVLGVVLAFSIHRLDQGRRLAESLYRLPVIVPHLVSVLLVYNILSRTGFLPRVLFHLGVLKDPAGFPFLLYNPNGMGIILAYLWKEIPFVALTTYTVLHRMSGRLADAARNLGASGLQTFRHVTLPLILPSVFSSFIIIFAFSFGAYEVPLLLGPTTPATLPVKAFIEYSNPLLQNRPYAMAINMIILIIALALTWLYFKAFAMVNRYEN